MMTEFLVVCLVNLLPQSTTGCDVWTTIRPLMLKPGFRLAPVEKGRDACTIDYDSAQRYKNFVACNFY